MTPYRLDDILPATQSRLSLDLIEAAALQIDPIFLNSPQFESEPLSQQLDLHLVLKVETINLRVGHHDTRWSKIFDLVWKFVLMMIAVYILYKVGFQAPPTP